MSHSAWTNRFRIGPWTSSVELNDEPYIVVEVRSDGFEFPTERTELWPGVSPEQATTEMRTILDRAAAERRRPPDVALETRVNSLREERGRPFRPALLMLAAATGLVLLIACANVAGLLLARGIARRRELAIRGALGAGTGRIVRQLLTESVVLSLAGGALGLAATRGRTRGVWGSRPERP